MPYKHDYNIVGRSPKMDKGGRMGTGPTFEWRLGQYGANIPRGMEAFVIQLFTLAGLTKNYQVTGGKQVSAHGGMHRGVEGVKVRVSQGPKTKNAVILAVQPGDNNTRREFLVYVHGHSAKHVAEKIQAVVTAAREDKVGKKPSPKVPVAGVVDSPLDQGLQKKLEELQAAITADEFVQLQFIGGAEIVHRNGHVRLRLTK
ncbi:MAG TPA: hypothetical protein VJH75_03470, partial [Patescibacteria group bacterium]|nr:hypothetical protein [Patescibacteria group bacterium]